MTDLDDMEKKALNGEPDPHGNSYDCERAALCMGKLTDDELANGAFLNYDVRPDVRDIIAGKAFSPIAWMTAVKDRIRWLSRKLEESDARCRKAEARVAELEAQSGEAIGEILRNSAGQIFIAGPDGNYFDMSKFIGKKLYLRAQQAAPEGWKPLTDAQWTNIVNLNFAWANYDKEDAIHEVVKLVEARLKANNAAAPSPEGEKNV